MRVILKITRTASLFCANASERHFPIFTELTLSFPALSATVTVNAVEPHNGRHTLRTGSLGVLQVSNVDDCSPNCVRTTNESHAVRFDRRVDFGLVGATIRETTHTKQIDSVSVSWVSRVIRIRRVLFIFLTVAYCAAVAGCARTRWPRRGGVHPVDLG